MKPTHFACASMLLMGSPAMAQIINNDIPTSTEDGGYTAVIEASNEEYSMLTAALNDPAASAADLGLASPGSTISLPDFEGAEE